MKRNEIEIVTTKDIEENTKEFSDILDALKDATQVYSKTNYHLDENFLWSKQPESNWMEFITRQKIVAMRIMNSFPKVRILRRDDKGNPERDEHGQYKYEERINPFAKQAHDLVMSPAYHWAILNRNTDENKLLMGILTFGRQDQNNILESLNGNKEDPSAGLVGKTLNKFFKKKEPTEKTIIG